MGLSLLGGSFDDVRSVVLAIPCVHSIALVCNLLDRCSDVLPKQPLGELNGNSAAVLLFVSIKFRIYKLLVVQ